MRDIGRQLRQAPDEVNKTPNGTLRDGCEVAIE